MASSSAVTGKAYEITVNKWLTDMGEALRS